VAPTARIWAAGLGFQRLKTTPTSLFTAGEHCTPRRQEALGAGHTVTVAPDADQTNASHRAQRLESQQL
jgi:hypothetical protein